MCPVLGIKKTGIKNLTDDFIEYVHLLKPLGT